MSEIESGDERTLEFLESNIDARIESFSSKRESYRSKSFLLTFSLALLSGAVTVLIGIQGADEDTKTILLNMALVLSSLMTLGSVVETFFSHKELWIKYTETVNALKELKSDLEYMKFRNKGDVSGDKLNSIYVKYNKILKDANSNWSSVRKRSSKTKRGAGV